VYPKGDIGALSLLFDSFGKGKDNLSQKKQKMNKKYTQ